MSIFGAIKDFLFGKQFVRIGKGYQAQSQPRAQTAPHGAASPASIERGAPAATPATARAKPVAERVDIAAILDDEARQSGQPLNWRQSIVDLMKLCGIDSSFQNRKSLAQELGYTGSADDSTAMNIWLHRQVLQKLEESGGKVPADLQD